MHCLSSAFFLFCILPSNGLWTLRGQESLCTVSGLSLLVLFTVLYIEWVLNMCLSNDEMNTFIFVSFSN